MKLQNRPLNASDALSSLLHEHRRVQPATGEQLTPAPFSFLPLRFVASPPPKMVFNGITGRREKRSNQLIETAPWELLWWLHSPISPAPPALSAGQLVPSPSEQPLLHVA